MQGVLHMFGLPCCPFGPLVSCEKKICVPSYRYDITFDGWNLCPERLLKHREALAVIKEQWEEVCGEYDGPRECYSKWVKTSIRPLIDAVKENYDLCARLIIKEYCDVLLLD